MTSQDYSDTRLTTAAVDLSHLSHNLDVLHRQAPNAEIWPCIKANAYGHGALGVARHLVGCGIDTFCVADIHEALELLDTDIDGKFIILSATLPEHAMALANARCEPAISTPEMAAALAAAGSTSAQTVPIHIKIDTGMGRLGIRPEDLGAFLDHCDSLPGIRVQGVMSHFATADEADQSVAERQLRRFADTVNELKDRQIPFRHMANSAALFEFRDSHYDAVRPGISIYGLKPSNNLRNPAVEELRPVLTLTSRIVFMKEFPQGAGLSYGHEFVTTNESLVATIPIGYGDGYPRGLSNKAEVLVRGVRCPQIGRVTMDLILVDVSALRGAVEIGDDVVLIGRQGQEEISADELAAKLGTINYEITTNLSGRITRDYRR